jgi:hypothetical protein
MLPVVCYKIIYSIIRNRGWRLPEYPLESRLCPYLHRWSLQVEIVQRVIRSQFPYSSIDTVQNGKYAETGEAGDEEQYSTTGYGRS